MERDIHVGLILREIGKCLNTSPNEAKIYFEQALATFQQSSSKSDEVNLAHTQLAFGYSLQLIGDHTNSKLLVQKSLQLFYETSANPEQDPVVMQYQLRFGFRLLELQKPEEAKEAFENALK